ncbi:MAG: protein translocase subunit SecF [Candidatus Nomurabacteria bacterium]|nr:MAG: protein translocase subunit SecF [Candidatus Nomurabacteria bacterium]
MTLKIIQKRKYFTIISAILVVASIVGALIWGLKPGIDFTGGSRLEISFPELRPELSTIQDALNPLDLGSYQAVPSNEKSLILKTRALSNDERQSVLDALSALQEEQVSEDSFTAIGPSIGQELRKKAYSAIALVLIGIIAYITWAFRKISRGGPVPSWVFGVGAIVALIHDISIIVGLFVLFGQIFGTEVDSLFVTALLTVLGFSVHDTIVVFDRIREGIQRYHNEPFEEIANRSINETMSRSINTSMTTLFVLVALAVLGGESIRMFVIALIAGIIVGTYSSIFIASTLLVEWHNWRARRFR